MTAAVSELRSFWPSGVTIITTFDAAGDPRGFTASSFCWLSSQPPLVSFFLARTAQSYAAFAAAEGFSVNVLQATHDDLAFRFATKGVDKFAGHEFVLTRDIYPELPSALISLQCRVRGRAEFVDHLAVVGEAVDWRLTPEAVPMIQYGGALRPLDARAALRTPVPGDHGARP